MDTGGGAAAYLNYVCGNVTRVVEPLRERPAPAWVVAGPPGAGKTTAARMLVGLLDPPPALLDKDTLYGDLVAALLSAAGRPFGEREGLWYDEHIKKHEYAGLLATAREIRAAGCPTVVVAPFTVQLRDPARWRELVQAMGGEPVRLIWLRTDPETLRNRLIRRGYDRDSAKLANYKEFLMRMRPEQEPDVPHVTVDNRDGARPMSVQLSEVAGVAA